MKRRITAVLAFIGAITALFLPGLLMGARNSSGTYVLPAGNPVITGTTITSSWANSTLGDIGTELTNSLDRGGRGAMTAPLQLSGGSAALPSLTFSAETNSGLYRNGSNDIRLQVAGINIQRWSSTGTTVPLALTAQAGATVTNVNSNSTAITATGTGTGAGVIAAGGTTSGTGGAFTGGAPNGAGITATSAGNGNAVTGTGGAGTGSGGIFTGGATNGNGLFATGIGTGAGTVGTGGTTSGFGGVFTGGVPNGAGLTSTALGTAAGAIFTGGASGGSGATLTGGATSGAGVVAAGGSPNGNGGQFTAAGSGKAITATPSNPNFTALESNGFINMAGAANPGTTTGFTNTVTPKNLVKAWAFVTVGNAGTAIVNDGFNISGCTVAAGTTVTCNFTTAMANANFASTIGIANQAPNTTDTVNAVETGRTSSSISYKFWLNNVSAGALTTRGLNFGDTIGLSIIIVGTQ